MLAATGQNRFHILTLGYGYRLIKNLWNPVAAETGFLINHIPHPSLFPEDYPGELEGIDCRTLHYLFPEPVKTLVEPDINFLRSLEDNHHFTIHNVILADGQLSQIPYAEALAYISMAGKSIQTLLSTIRPDVVLSGFEGWHSSLTMLICKNMGITWYGLVYTAIPRGLFGFSSTNNSSETRGFGIIDPEEVKITARQTLVNFRKGAEKAYIPVVEDSLTNIVRLLPRRITNFSNKLRIIASGKFDRYTHRSSWDAFVDYTGRIWNMLRSHSVTMLRKPPESEFAFFAFHMQPEMAIDVWAPYYSNQIWVVNLIARSMPAGQKLLVKLHRIDSGRWNYSELMQLSSMPAVELVHESAIATEFIKKANIVFSIQGTVAFEAAMLGRNVVTFGETMYEDFPNVHKVTVLEQLPVVIREILRSAEPDLKDIEEAVVRLLSRFRSGVFNNWEMSPSSRQITDFCAHIKNMAREIETAH